MRTKRFALLLAMGLLLSACLISQPQISTVEVTRVVRETEIVTVEVTQIVQQIQFATVEVTHIAPETPLATPTFQPGLVTDILKSVALHVPRAHHTATLLPDGRILLVGGSQSSNEHLVEVEIFDPASGSITQVAPLHTARRDHSATLLLDGRVLVVGGSSQPRQWLEDAELYNPAEDTWMVVPPLYSHGVQHTATLMKDGRVLVVGGCIDSGVCTDRVEIFDPQTNSWAEASPLESSRASHSAVLLEDGRVLVAGGGGGESGAPAGGDALLYDPQTNTWKATGAMVIPRVFAQSVRLTDGRVLAVGGRTLDTEPVQTVLNGAELFDPATNTWTAVSSLREPRMGFALLLRADGQVLAIGGTREYSEEEWTARSLIREIESYDPALNHWHVVGRLPQAVAYATTTLLPDGRLWVAGGQGGKSSAAYWADTWMITP